MSTGYPLLLVVAAALIDSEGRVLVQQRAPDRSMPGLWEFPGGKVEPGETPEHALARELVEELGVTVAPSAFSPLAFASEALGERHLLLLLYAAREWRGEPMALDASAIRWVNVEEMRTLAMPPADVPLVEALAALSLVPA
ncbi:(deoxy)nucleoside triphosphate pyrophosphohydrolase [Sphingomonas tabacisoli]|uniref:8-oxo-dGTP diphosphatase n=1 Tax=Sphingomonas tabacisoli TaxID=2249466 RepID=A0ABW4I4L7_9SPHN